MIRHDKIEINEQDLYGNIGKIVTAYGRISRKRSIGKSLSFATVKTHIGEIQIVSAGIEIPSVGSIVEINGKLESNPVVKTGFPGLEISAQEVKTLFLQIGARPIKDNIKTRVENRYIDLRNQQTALIFKSKSEALQVARQLLASLGFWEVYSTRITGSSAEGPLDAFPVNYFGHEAFLSVSNALFHLEVLAGDVPKIFEIGPCFRGTRSKTKRHVNEFTILDFSASFINREGFMKITENLVRAITEKLSLLGHKTAKAILGQLTAGNFEMISYKEALRIADRSHSSPSDPQRSSRGLFHDQLKDSFKSFLWIIDFPEKEKSFYVKSRQVGDEMLCYNFQLWHPGIGNLMDGAERITCPIEARKKLVEKGLEPQNFEKYLDILEGGLPPCASAGFAFDRFIQLALGLDDIREVILFPRDNLLIPK